LAPLKKNRSLARSLHKNEFSALPSTHTRATIQKKEKGKRARNSFLKKLLLLGWKTGSSLFLPLLLPRFS